jgi:hypothetical protein
MQTDADTALLGALRASTHGAPYELAMAAHDRLSELLKQKEDMFKQLIEQLNEIDDLKYQLEKK